MNAALFASAVVLMQWFAVDTYGVSSAAVVATNCDEQRYPPPPLVKVSFAVAFDSFSHAA